MMFTTLFIVNFFVLTGVIGGFLTTILLTVASRRFLKGDVKTFSELLLCGCMFLYSFLVTQFLIDAFLLRGTFLELFKGLFIYLAFIYFIFAGVYVHEIAKALGFASEKVPEKLKRILKS